MAAEIYVVHMSRTVELFNDNTSAIDCIERFAFFYRKITKERALIFVLFFAFHVKYTSYFLNNNRQE